MQEKKGKLFTVGHQFDEILDYIASPNSHFLSSPLTAEKIKDNSDNKNSEKFLLKVLYYNTNLHLPTILWDLSKRELQTKSRCGPNGAKTSQGVLLK